MSSNDFCCLAMPPGISANVVKENFVEREELGP